MSEDLNSNIGEIISQVKLLNKEERRKAITNVLEYKKQKKRVWTPNPGPQTLAYYSEADELFFGGQAGGGKGLVLTSNILTPLGWKAAGKVREGDNVCAIDGTVTQVSRVFRRGVQKIYKLSWSDGSTTTCDGDHIWRGWWAGGSRKIGGVITSGEGAAANWDTNEIISKFSKEGAGRFCIPAISAPCAFNVQGELRGRGNFIRRSLHPYILGVLLGDGYLNGSEIRWTKPDIEIADRVNTCLGAALPAVLRESADRAPAFAIPSGTGVKDQLSDLKLLGTLSATKFIPRIYLFASAEERWELLMGLMDTDGWAEADGDCYFGSVSKQLAEDVRHLARSLGAVVSWREKDPTYTYKGETLNGQHFYTLRIKMRNPERMFSLERKKNVCAGKQPQHMAVFLNSIEPAGEEETVCFQVRHASSLFIIDGFIVTHNTALICGLAIDCHRQSHIFRRQSTQIRGIVQEISNILGDRRGFNQQSGVWNLDGTRAIELGGLKDEQDKEKWQGRAADLKCVAAGTLVLMGDGSFRPVEEVRAGDLVETLAGPSRVSRAFRKRDNAIKSSAYVGGKLVAQQVQGAAHKLMTVRGWETGSEHLLLLSQSGGTQLMGFEHPYTSQMCQSAAFVRSAVQTVEPAGEMELFDLTVDGANHYITAGGFINKNCFDEITSFTESQYRYICGWNRSTHPGQRCRIVATGNPPTTAEGLWVIRYWAAWLDSTHNNPARPGELRWYTTVAGVDHEVDGPGPHEVNGKLLRARSRTFIPSRLEDNPDLMESNYAAVLESLPEELRIRLREGKFGMNITDDEFQVIPTDWVLAAQSRWTPRKPEGVPMSAVGVDVASGGGDRTALACRYGTWFGPVTTKPGKETPDGPSVAALVMMTMKDGCHIVLDMGGGWSGSAYDHMKANDWLYITPVNPQCSSNGKAVGSGLKFRNKRAELWWRFREALDPGLDDEFKIALPPDSELRADLCCPKWKNVSSGIQIEEKENIRHRLGRSPDKGDAVIMAWYGGSVKPQHRASRALPANLPRMTNLDRRDRDGFIRRHRPTDGQRIEAREMGG